MWDPTTCLPPTHYTHLRTTTGYHARHSPSALDPPLFLGYRAGSSSSLTPNCLCTHAVVSTLPAPRAARAPYRPLPAARTTTPRTAACPPACLLPCYAPFLLPAALMTTCAPPVLPHGSAIGTLFLECWRRDCRSCTPAWTLPGPFWWRWTVRSRCWRTTYYPTAPLRLCCRYLFRLFLHFAPKRMKDV